MKLLIYTNQSKIKNNPEGGNLYLGYWYNRITTNFIIPSYFKVYKVVYKMNKKERIFNRQYIKYGGIFLDNNSESGRSILKQINQVRDKVNNYYDDKKSIFITPNGIEEKILKNINLESGKYHPYINVFCADKNDVNAFAGKIDDEYYLGMLKGVFLNLRNHIKEYVEDENFKKIPEIGKCFPEAILNSLVEHCLDFFAFHEFFHIMNGHCDLITNMGISELCEENLECDTKGIDLQTLEFDADCCAISAIVNEYFRMQYMALNSIAGVNGRPNIESTIQFISGLLISVFILNSWLNTRRIVSYEISETYLENMTHPLPGMRATYIWTTINTILGKSAIYSKEEFEQISECSYKSVFTFIEEFSDIAYPGFLKPALSSVGLRHLQKIHDNWKNIRELLTVHYCDLAPFEEIDIESMFKGR